MPAWLRCCLESSVGVVVPELKGNGARSLRVVDASGGAMLPAAHLQATLYGVAEKIKPKT